MRRLTVFGTNWRGLTVTSVFQIPGVTVLLIIPLVMAVMTVLTNGSIEEESKAPQVKSEQSR